MEKLYLDESQMAQKLQQIGQKMCIEPLCSSMTSLQQHKRKSNTFFEKMHQMTKFELKVFTGDDHGTGFQTQSNSKKQNFQNIPRHIVYKFQIPTTDDQEIYQKGMLMLRRQNTGLMSSKLKYIPKAPSAISIGAKQNNRPISNENSYRSPRQNYHIPAQIQQNNLIKQGRSLLKLPASQSSKRSVSRQTGRVITGLPMQRLNSSNQLQTSDPELINQWQQSEKKKSQLKNSQFNLYRAHNSTFKLSKVLSNHSKKQQLQLLEESEFEDKQFV